MTNVQAAGRLQDHLAFTVKIVRVSDRQVVGTGIIVSALPDIVTCAHVVREAGLEPKGGRILAGMLDKVVNVVRLAFGGKSPPLGHVIVVLPWERGAAAEQMAVVDKWFAEMDDDIVVLRLLGDAPSLSSEHVAVLGTADHSRNNHFTSYGYRRVGTHRSNWCDGLILGPVETDGADRLHAEPIQLRSAQIGAGDSGSAVLDVNRNLVVGVVSEALFANASEKGRDDAWAVNAKILALDPLAFNLQDSPLPTRPTRGPEPAAPLVSQPAGSPRERRVSWNTAPPKLANWVGREELLTELTKQWEAGVPRVIGLIGMAGQGKSSFARQWLDELLSGTSFPPDSVFWWSFNHRSGVDEFLEAALNHFAPAERFNKNIYASAAAKVHLLAGLLYSGRHIIVLDGLEAVQHLDSDCNAMIASPELLQFLTYVAASAHQSLCVVTSRLPISELMAYATYLPRKLGRLTSVESRQLLRSRGVHGTDNGLDWLSTAWNDSPLTLDLFARLVAERYDGDATRAATDILPPTGRESSIASFRRLLDRYCDELTADERELATVLSAFRMPTPAAGVALPLTAIASARPASEREARPDVPPVLEALVQRGLLRREMRVDGPTNYYFSHPLMRDYYSSSLMALPDARRTTIHRACAVWYQEQIRPIGDSPAFEQVVPVIEAVHHLCQAGDYVDAWNLTAITLYKDSILTYKLAAYEAALTLWLEFFPDGDATRDPRISEPQVQRFILNDVGLSLMYLGRPAKAGVFYERKISIAARLDDWINVSSGHWNLVELHVFLGDLRQADRAASEAIVFAGRAVKTAKSDAAAQGAIFAMMTALAYSAWVSSLRGDIEAATAQFEAAQEIERRREPGTRFLFSNRGVFHADHLRRTGDASRAFAIATANLERCKREHWVQDVSRNHRILGDLGLDAGNVSIARRHYDEALLVARRTSFRPALIEALVGHARWLARSEDSKGARMDLDEALELTTASGYRLYEMDVRLTLAEIKRQSGAMIDGRLEAERVLKLSTEMNYHWGLLGAEVFLSQL